MLIKFYMDKRDKLKRIARLQSEIQDIKEALHTDEEDGYLLRGYIRQRLEDRVDSLQEEIQDLNLDIFSDN